MVKNARLVGLVIVLAALPCLALGMMIPDAKKLPDGDPVQLVGMTVTYVATDFFYIEQLDAISGIRVETTSGFVFRGDMIDVMGTIWTNPDKERYITPSGFYVLGMGPGVRGHYMKNKDVGGGPFGYQLGVYCWQWVYPPGEDPYEDWLPLAGPNNIGLYVKTAGRVTQVVGGPGPQLIYIDDGSKLEDHLRTTVGVRVECDLLPMVMPGDWVLVSGVCSCYLDPDPAVDDPLCRILADSVELLGF